MIINDNGGLISNSLQRKKKVCYLQRNKDKWFYLHRATLKNGSVMYVNTKGSCFLCVGTVKCVYNVKQLCILWEGGGSFQPQQQQRLAKRKHGRETKPCLFTDAGLQGLAEYDATVITQPSATQAMLTAGSFTQTLVIAAFKNRAILSLTRRLIPPPLRFSAVLTESLCASSSRLASCMI